jgi:SAM-dependent methyltransferase
MTLACGHGTSATATVSDEASEKVEGFDAAEVSAFASKAMADMAGALASIMCSLGDKLGLFRTLAGSGPVTCEELADAMSFDRRYLREWLGALVCAQYLAYDTASRKFSLPPEHAIALAAEGQPMFLGGAYQQLPGLFGPLDEVAQAFADGSGVPPEAYGGALRESMDRISSAWFDHLLVQEWIPSVPGLQERLEEGADVADIGSGWGRAVIALARAFPRSRFVGFESFGPSVQRARTSAREAGVDARVQFERLEVLDSLPGWYDLVTSFDVIHDIAQPARVLRTIRQALRREGVYLLLEINSSARLEENVGPVGTILYGTSVLYCTPTSIAAGGEGLGTVGLPEPKVRALCADAGFTSVRPVPPETPFNVLYEVRP